MKLREWALQSKEERDKTIDEITNIHDRQYAYIIKPKIDAGAKVLTYEECEVYRKKIMDMK